MSSGKKRRSLSDWYTVSAGALKGWGFVLVLAVLGTVGVLGYRFLDQMVLEGEIKRIILEAEDLLRTVRTEGAISSYREEYSIALGHLETAREHQNSGSLQEAFRSAERSRTLLASILGTLRVRGSEGEAMFIAVQGGVQYRRGDRGGWQSARSRVALNAGDYVKTAGGGSAEIMSADGNLFTVRPDTILLIGRVRPASGAPRQEAINLEAGWVDLGTTANSSRVSTPQAEAEIQKDSRAAIGHDPTEDTSHFAAYEGEVVVSTIDGASQTVGPLEQVEQTGGVFQEPKKLLAAPELVGPEDNLEATLTATGNLVLEWRPVQGADRYALQVAPTRFFVQNIIDIEDRETTSATVGLQNTGNFVWRVAAFDKEGHQGPWSPIYRFRVSRGAQTDESGEGSPASE